MVALDHVDHCEREIDALSGSERSVAGKIADRHREIGSTFKRAEILSNLAVADAVADLTRTLATIPGEARGPEDLSPHSLAIWRRVTGGGEGQEA